MNDTPQTTVSEVYKMGAADVLDTIANLSNDEVFTPPKLANQVLNLLPEHVWSDSSLKFLDPCVKTGVFLREIVKRLMVGLKNEIPDVEERREHILRNQIYGIAITELTALMSRRTVYCSSDATREKNDDFPENCYSAVKFDDPDGNIVFPKADHDWNKVDLAGDPEEKAKCKICGASSKDFAGSHRSGMESHAYPFIHMDQEKIWGKEMKFDVIIGNPPYQIADAGKSTGASPIYQKFINRAKTLNPKHLSMIVPARWYAGGKGLDDFRAEMIADKNISVLCDVPNAGDCFPGVEIKGGVCYFMRKDTPANGCEVRTVEQGSVKTSVVRALDDFDIFIRSNDAVSILNKVLDKSVRYVDEFVSSQKPFSFRTNFEDFSEEYFEGAVKIYARGRIGWVDQNLISTNSHWVPKHKVITSMAYGAGESFPHQITGKPIVTDIPSCCTETYLVAGVFDDRKEAEFFASYMKTRFFRFMVYLRKNTQHITKDRFRFVPAVDLSEEWTDQKLYTHFGLTQTETDFIESMIKEMP